MVDPNFWRGKRVLVTGHTGFKGSWLTLWLSHMGARVNGFSLPPPTVPNLFELAEVGAETKSFEGDIRDLNGLRAAFKDVEPEIVFHLAAQPLVRHSYDDPIETFSTNVLGTVNVLEMIREHPSVRSAVIVTTDKCYENREWIWAYREDESMGGHDPYSSSKGCAELVTSSYRRSFFSSKNGPQIASARAGNVIGGGDFSKDRLIPDFIRAISKNSCLEIRNPGAVRPWQHALEPISGYLLLAEKLANSGEHDYAGAWNFGPVEDDAWSVERVVKVLRKNISVPSKEPIFGAPSGPHEAQFLKLDISKAKYKLNWTPKLSLEEGLRWTGDWYSEYLGRCDVKSLTRQQLASYLDIVPAKILNQREQ